MRSRHVVFISSLMIILLCVVGCGQKKSTEPQSLNMWVMPNSQDPVIDIETVLAPFKKQHPEIKINVVALDWGSAWQKITAAATSGTGPDIVQLGSTWVSMVDSMGALSDLTQHVKQISPNSVFVPSMLTMMGVHGSNKVSALPWIVDVRAMFYRTDVFRKLGLTAKNLDTWESFEATLAKIKKANLNINGVNVAPLGITGKNDWNVVHSLSPWIWAGGGDYFTPDYKKANLLASDASKGVSYYIGLTSKGYVPIACLEKNSYQLGSEFDNGAYAICFDGPFHLKTLTTPSERGGAADLPVAKNFSIAPYPKGPLGRFTYGGGSFLAVFKYSKNQKEAWEVIKYLSTNPEAQVAYAKLTGFIPASKEALKDPYFRADPQRNVFVESLSFAKTYPNIAYWGSLEMTTLPRRFGLMWSDVLNDIHSLTYLKIKKQMETADQEINSILTQ